MTGRRPNIGYPERAKISPYAWGWAALVAEGTAIVGIGVLAWLVLRGVLDSFWAAVLSPSAAFAMPAIAAGLLVKGAMPLIFPITRHLSRCPVCDKPTLLTSADFAEWDVRANPDGHVAGQRRFRPEAYCSACDTNLRETA